MNQKTEQKEFAVWTWILASELLTGFTQHIENPCKFAYVKLTTKERKLIEKVKAVVDTLPDGVFVHLPIEDSVIFIDNDVDDEEGILDEALNEVETAQSSVEVSIEADISDFDLEGHKFAVISKNGVAFELDDEIGTCDIGWSDIL